MPELIIDFHTHVFPDPLSELSQKLPVTYVPDLQTLNRTRARLRRWARPVARALHDTQTLIRHFPDSVRPSFDRLGALIAAPSLLVESTPQDLTAEMQELGVSRAVVIANPPLAPNSWILRVCRENEGLIPCVYAPDSAEKLREWVDQGARLLKIHPSMDGKGPEDENYLRLLEVADALKLPVILHTGCIHLEGIYRSPNLSRAENFRPWFDRFRSVPFVLAHMNYHDPHTALDLCAEFPNLFVDTSWQPTEVIAEGVRRIGSERILLGSDWPLLGANLPTSIARVREITRFGVCNDRDVENILGKNAARILGGDA
jgi:predicted TIM-barrel fold metal-dependent hydrolase